MGLVVMVGFVVMACVMVGCVVMVDLMVGLW